MVMLIYTEHWLICPFSGTQQPATSINRGMSQNQGSSENGGPAQTLGQRTKLNGKIWNENEDHDIENGNGGFPVARCLTCTMYWQTVSGNATEPMLFVQTRCFDRYYNDVLSFLSLQTQIWWLPSNLKTSRNPNNTRKVLEKWPKSWRFSARSMKRWVNDNDNDLSGWGLKSRKVTCDGYLVSKQDFLLFLRHCDWRLVPGICFARYLWIGQGNLVESCRSTKQAYCRIIAHRPGHSISISRQGKLSKSNTNLRRRNYLSDTSSSGQFWTKIKPRISRKFRSSMARIWRSRSRRRKWRILWRNRIPRWVVVPSAAVSQISLRF